MTSANTIKKCPFCAEEIQSEAIKCKHCGSSLQKGSSGKSPKDSLDVITKWQKITNWSLLATIISFPLVFSSWPILFILALLCHVVAGMRLVWLVKLKHKWLLVFSPFFGIVILGFLHNANDKATKLRRAAGQKVGPFGGIFGEW